MVRGILIFVMLSLAVASFAFMTQGQTALASLAGILAGVPAFGLGFMEKPSEAKRTRNRKGMWVAFVISVASAIESLIQGTSLSIQAFTVFGACFTGYLVFRYGFRE